MSRKLAEAIERDLSADGLGRERYERLINEADDEIDSEEVFTRVRHVLNR